MYVHLTLAKSAFQDGRALEDALRELQAVGGFTEWSTTYASRAGIVQGELPAENVERVRALPCVEALTAESVMQAF